METCDVLIAGGGPAGSTCARRLVSAGLDVVVMDRAYFPRDKVCAGWITPQVVSALALDLDDYRRGRTLQPITGFRTGLVGAGADLATSYGRAVSYGVRRCEFDHYLLTRAGARTRLGAPVLTIRREGTGFVVNESIKAGLLVGAGGHFCPVARWLNPQDDRRRGAPLVVARETEFPIAPAGRGRFSTDPEQPALFFSPDLTGYGWCVRKQDYMNVGFGHLGGAGLVRATEGFVEFLAARGLVPPSHPWRWRGHAYYVYPSPRRLVGPNVVLVGDAAGLAYAQSGEGIRPAVESGLMAATTILERCGHGEPYALDAYVDRLGARFGDGRLSRTASATLPGSAARAFGRGLLRSRLLVRHIVLNRWFLHAGQPSLAPC